MRVIRGPAGAFAGVAGGPPLIALSFDDGPGRGTEVLLDLLAAVGARATFFVVGERVSSRAELVARAERAGHEIGNHSWSHPALTALSPALADAELRCTSEAIEAATGRPPRCFRPPFGAVDKRLVASASRLGMATVTWNVDPEDWSAETSAEQICDRVLEAAAPGSIVLLHESEPRTTTLEALGDLLDGLSEEGLEPVTVAELLGLGGSVAG